jgi:CPA2 family monovalent cation:H+ antiporter-2
MHLPPLIRDLAVILGVAGLSSLLFKRLKQPVVLGYLVAGLVVGPHTPPFSWVTDPEGISTWSELGVIFLMFSLGLEFSFGRLLKLGRAPLITGPLEAILMSLLGAGLGWLMGWSAMDCVFLGAILAVSSTAIIIKSIEEMGLKRERFAELVFGVLVVEDLVGILMLVALAGLGGPGGAGGAAGGEGWVASLAWMIGKLALLLGGCLLAGHFAVTRLVAYVARRAGDEALLLVSLSLGLGLVALAVYLRFSSALGAFVMGSVLAGSGESHRIEQLVKPLRDVFAAVFFVSVGMLLDPSDLVVHWRPIALVSGATVVGKVASTWLGARLSGQPNAVAVQAGASMAQIGEFSFIIATLGLSLRVMSPFLYPVAVCVSVVTTFLTPYLIRGGRAYAKRLEGQAA